MIFVGKFLYEMKYEFFDNWLGSMNKCDWLLLGFFGLDFFLYIIYSVRIIVGMIMWIMEDIDDNRVIILWCEVGCWDIYGIWDFVEIIGDFIDGFMGNFGKVLVSNIFDSGNLLVWKWEY